MYIGKNGDCIPCALYVIVTVGSIRTNRAHLNVCKGVDDLSVFIGSVDSDPWYVGT